MCTKNIRNIFRIMASPTRENSKWCILGDLNLTDLQQWGNIFLSQSQRNTILECPEECCVWKISEKCVSRKNCGGLRKKLNSNWTICSMVGVEQIDSFQRFYRITCYNMSSNQVIKLLTFTAEVLNSYDCATVYSNNFRLSQFTIMISTPKLELSSCLSIF